MQGEIPIDRDISRDIAAEEELLITTWSKVLMHNWLLSTEQIQSVSAAATVMAPHFLSRNPPDPQGNPD